MKPESNPIKIGWSSVDITPDWPVNLKGQFNVRIATRALDPITATALALESENQAQGFILVSVDCVQISLYVQQAFRRLIAERLPGFNPDQIVLHGTHTHTAPQQSAPESWYPPLPDSFKAPEAYGDFLAERLARVAAEAWQARRLGGIAWGQSFAAVGFNRRSCYLNGQAIMYGSTADPMFSHVEGNCDHSVNLLYTFDPENQLTGVLVNVACPSQCTENLSEISADYWHEVRVDLRGRLGAGLFILPQCSAAGDQSPHHTINQAAEERMTRLMGFMDHNELFVIAQRRVIGRRISQAVEEALPAVRNDIRTSVELTHEQSVFPVPRRLLTPWETNESNRIIAEANQKLALIKEADPISAAYSVPYAQKVYYTWALARHARQQAGDLEMPVVVHAMRIGDVAMTTNRFEYYLDFGQRIKARSRALQTFVVQLAGEGAYLPTARSVAGGGYGSWFASSPASAEAGTKIVEESLRLINQWF